MLRPYVSRMTAESGERDVREWESRILEYEPIVSKTRLAQIPRERNASGQNIPLVVLDTPS
jgi:hypothetical protein